MRPALHRLSPAGAAWRFLLAALLFVVSARTAATLAIVAGPPAAPIFDAVYRPAWLLFLLVGYGAMLIFADAAHDRPLAAMGLDGEAPWLKQAFIGVLFGSGMVAVGVTAIAVAGDVTFHISLGSHLLLLVAGQFFILATAAMAEEVTFRGYPFQVLVRGFGPLVATLLASVLFAALHFQNPYASLWGMFNTVAIGVMLSLAYLRTRALWLPWGIHFGWNVTLGVIFGLPVSGIRTFGVAIEGAAYGPEWLTGGNYGLEGSVTAVVVILAGTALLLKVFPSPPLLPEPPVEPAFPGIQPPETPDEPTPPGNGSPAGL